MTDEELNRAAAKAMGWTIGAFSTWPGDTRKAYVRPGYSINLCVENWRPATKIEHAWIVQQACDADAFRRALGSLRPDGHKYLTWLATAPPRARTEAAVACLTSKGEAT